MGAGALIWGYNFVQGKNLAKPPVFDLSIYDELRIPHPDELFRENDNAELNNITNTGEADSGKLEVDEFIYQYNSIYFSKFFRGETPIETNKNLKDFIGDFVWLNQFEVKDLIAKKCFVINVPLENRSEILGQLKSHELVNSVEPGLKGAPEFDLCFIEDNYIQVVNDFLHNFETVDLIGIEELLDHIAVINFGDDFELLKEKLDKFQLEYSDVVKVVGSK